MKPTLLLTALLTVSLCFTACKEEKEDFSIAPAADYLPTQPGKYIIYRVDSTVFTQQGRVEERHSYQQKDVVDAAITDAQGRPSYRVYRYLRDTAGTGPWKSSGTYFITPTNGTVEVIENNMRVVRLVSPVKQGGAWKGNRYLSTEPYSSTYLFGNDDNIADWNFSYTGTNDVFVSGQKTYKDVLTVEQVNDIMVIDTLNVASNKAVVPSNYSSVWIRGAATDTVRVEAAPPATGRGKLTLYNQTNFYATLNTIRIPPRMAFQFEYFNNQWTYPNTLLVVNNQVSIPKDVSTVFVGGTASGPIQINTSNIEGTSTGRITIYNRSNFNAFADFNATLSTVSIPPGFGRSYEYVNNSWRLSGNSNTLLDKDPFTNETPFGSKNYSLEKYAKGVGLVFQELLMWEYQPNPNGTPYKIGFGIKRSIIEHN
ncbi:MAG: hypothetical protein JWP69_966 [Flaviaesturariibacter sp.]|nr:hypothetical protein [Flaviaesturariibacter sp.]